MVSSFPNPSKTKKSPEFITTLKNDCSPLKCKDKAHGEMWYVSLVQLIGKTDKLLATQVFAWGVWEWPVSRFLHGLPCASAALLQMCPQSLQFVSQRNVSDNP